MNKVLRIFFFAILSWNLAASQTKSEIDSLINNIGLIHNSKEIIKTEQAKKITNIGKNSLPILAEIFTDLTLTNVNSECQERNLTKGEIAIIMADHIEGMPYATLTGQRNCLLTYCENNPNFIEYYLWAIRQDGIANFQNKYVDWIYDKDRLNWPIKLKGNERKTRKKEIRKYKRTKKKYKE